MHPAYSHVLNFRVIDRASHFTFVLPWNFSVSYVYPQMPKFRTSLWGMHLAAINFRATSEKNQYHTADCFMFRRGP